MPEVNIPLLRKCIEWAEAEHAKGEALSEWWQGMWAVTPQERDEGIFGMPQKAPECGTTYCIAGYICESQGLHDMPGWAGPAAAALGLVWSLGFYGDEVDAPAANRLFYANNTIEDVRRIAEDIAGERL